MTRSRRRHRDCGVDEEVAGSEDADFEVDEDLHDDAEEEDENSSSSGSGKPSRRVSKAKVVADEFYENPDLYGLRRSVRAASCSDCRRLANFLLLGTRPPHCPPNGTSAWPPPTGKA